MTVVDYTVLYSVDLIQTYSFILTVYVSTRQEWNYTNIYVLSSHNENTLTVLFCQRRNSALSLTESSQLSNKTE